MFTETPYKLNVSDSQLELLQKKLALVTFPDELENAEWDYGAPLADIQRLVSHWKEGYNWRSEEASINADLPQYTCDIEVEGHGALNIHYVHQKSSILGAIPLLFVHGWPGSFLEVRKILPLLTAVSPEHPSFHVVALSIPGFGPSQAPKLKGFSLDQYTEVAQKLMTSLGYDQFVTQGGDWGYIITRALAVKYGDTNVKAWHTNMAVATKPQDHVQSTPYTEFELAGLERAKWFREKSYGYFAQQTTQPQTLGYALADSPVALLAWIYEKLHHWADDYSWTDDEVLTWVSIYLFSRAGPNASLRIYYEVRWGTGDVNPTVPHGVSYFPRDLILSPSSWMHASGNIVFESRHTSGGHFAAHEQPEELVKDLRAMYEKGGPAFGVVGGKTGY